MSRPLKPFKTFDEQIDLLVNSHNLTILDREKAKQILNNINYYTVRGYGEVFETTPANDEYQYKDGTTLDDIYYIYLFDSHLKSILMRALGIIEKNLRTNISYNFVLLHDKDPQCYIDGNNFYFWSSVQGLLNKILRQHLKFTKKKIFLIDKNDIVLKTHIEKYECHFPLWVIIEYFSMGDLLAFYGSMHEIDQENIARLYNISTDDFDNQLYVLKFIRNKCAHFNRIINKKLPKINKFSSNDLYHALLIIKNWINDQSEWEDIIGKIKELIFRLVKKYPHLDLNKIFGFPTNWEIDLK